LLIEEYFKQLEKDISDAPYVIQSRLTKDRRSLHIGFTEGRIDFIDGSVLHFMEFADARGNERYKYSYHYQDRDGEMIFRYDMAPHHQEIATFPHHKHISSQDVTVSDAPNLSEILEEIGGLIA
jgi:hypothetical protein